MSTKNNNNSPIELVGNWKDDRRGKYNISNDCSYFIVRTSPYIINDKWILRLENIYEVPYTRF